MATRIFAVSPDLKSYDVQENVGPTATSAIVAVVVDLTTTAITDGSGSRGPTKREVLQALEYITEAIIRKNTWPPA